MPKRPRALQQSQLISNVARDTGLPIITVRKVFAAYADIAKNEFMAGNKIPLPAGMGYVYASITRSTSRVAKVKFSASPVHIEPKLRTIATFSEPWKESINKDPRASELIKRLISEKDSSTT